MQLGRLRTTSLDPATLPTTYQSNLSLFLVKNSDGILCRAQILHIQPQEGNEDNPEITVRLFSFDCGYGLLTVQVPAIP